MTNQPPISKRKEARALNQMVAKLRRLADCLEGEKQFQIKIAGERIKIPASAIFNIEHERVGNTEEVEFLVQVGKMIS